MILFKKPSIYIEVTDAALTLATIKHTRGKYCFKNIQSQPLNKLDVIDGIIFNQTALFTSILKFVHSINLTPTKCTAILALPSLSNTGNIPPHCATLQAALCAAKTGLAITQVIPNSLNPNTITPIIKNKPLKKLPNLLQPFLRQNKPPLAWWATGTILLLASTALYCIDQVKNQQRRLHARATEREELRSRAHRLEDAHAKIDLIEKSTNEALASIASLKNFSSSNIGASPLLQAVTEHIPNRVVLTTLELGRNKNKNRKRIPITKNLNSLKNQRPQVLLLTLKGLSYNADEIITFNKALGSVKQLKNVRLTELKQLKLNKIDRKAKKTRFRYGFTLQASVRSDVS